MRGVPLATILVSVAVVVLTYLAGKLAYRIRDVLLMIAVAGFVCLILNPLVVALQRWGIRRRGWAVAMVTRFHLQVWVTHNAPKLQSLGMTLAKPALTAGKGAASLLATLATIFALIVLFLLEGPKMRQGLLGLMPPQRAAPYTCGARDLPVGDRLRAGQPADVADRRRGHRRSSLIRQGSSALVAGPARGYWDELEQTGEDKCHERKQILGQEPDPSAREPKGGRAPRLDAYRRGPLRPLWRPGLCPGPAAQRPGIAVLRASQPAVRGRPDEDCRRHQRRDRTAHAHGGVAIARAYGATGSIAFQFLVGRVDWRMRNVHLARYRKDAANEPDQGHPRRRVTRTQLRPARRRLGYLGKVRRLPRRRDADHGGDGCARETTAIRNVVSFAQCLAPGVAVA